MLEGKLINIRQIKKSDLVHIQSWINDAEVQYFSQEEYPLYFSPWLIKKLYSDGIKGKRYILIIEDKKGNVVGELWLFPMDMARKITELVIIIGKKEARGKGYGRDAIKLISSFCFDRLKLDAMYLKVFSFNTRAISCYKACGFKVIGKGTKKVIRGNLQYDELIMVLSRIEREGQQS